MNTNPDILVRPYAPQDREAIRRICCDTADAGNPVERFFPDRRIFADLLTRYYTDFEPQSSLVAVEEGCVVGYLTGCLRTRRFHRVMALRIVPATLINALRRGTFWHPQVRALLRGNLGLWLRDGWRRKIPLAGYPSHLHINLRTRCRGSGVGQRLMRDWLAYAREHKVAGVHAGINADNAGAIQFFEAQGFTLLGREGRMRLPGEEHLQETVVYGLVLRSN